MSDDFIIPKFKKCPCCGDWGLDALKTHSHCVGCGQSPTFQAEHNYAIPQWAFDELAKANLLTGIGEKKRARR